MMQIQEIGNGVSFEKSESVKTALQKIRSVPEHELHFYLVMRDTIQATFAETRKLITLAQIESDRRASDRTWWLAVTTTVVSGIVGLLGVLLGAYIT